VFFLLVVAVLRAATPFPQEGSDLKPDPAARFGTLPNGLRYVVRANAEPKHRASLRLLVEAGSRHETPEQLGLAHFLEHMAFNGSEQFAPGTLIGVFQRMGMNFGGDTNASTSFDRTLYLLELPDTAEATLGEGLRVFHDYAGGLLLKSDQIDRERGVVLSEKRTRDSVGYRTSMAMQRFLLAGTRVPERPPIGVTEVLNRAQREQFVQFYNQWYRPELMSVIVVGDVDPEAVEKQIVAAFTPLAARSPAVAAPDLGQVTPTEGVRAFHYPEPEATATTVRIALVTPYRREPDTAARRQQQVPRSLAYAMLSRRLSLLAKQQEATFSAGGASSVIGHDLFRESSIVLTCKADQWSAAVGTAEQELRRALEHGFTADELKEAVTDRQSGLRGAVRAAPTRRSAQLAEGIALSLLHRTVFTSPETDVEVLKPALDKVTVADCLAALRADWAGKGRNVLVTGNAKIEGDAPSAILAAYGESTAVAVTAPEARADVPWAYTNFGPPGKVAHREYLADLDVTLVTFENGVRVNLKKTDFSANRVSVNLSVGVGRLTEPSTQPGLGIYAARTQLGGGLGKHSADELRRVLAGRNSPTTFTVGGDILTWSSSATRGGIGVKCQVLAAYLTDPGYRPEGARQARKGIDETYLGFEHTVAGPLSLEVAHLLAGGDHRFGFPPKAQLLARTTDEVKAWIGPQLAHGAVELAFVGDLDVEATIVAVGRTLGALPKRDERPALDDLHRVAFPAQPIDRRYTVATEIPKGTVSLYWPTTDGRDARRALRLRLLADILTERLRVKVREELGDAYSPRAGSYASDVYPNYGYISSTITVDPSKAEKVGDVVVALADKLAHEAITADDLERAKKPALTSVRDAERKNAYWIQVLARAQERPELLERARTREADVTSITAEELSVLAKQYLGAARVSRVIVVPATKPAAVP
jgi:zinc protease